MKSNFAIKISLFGCLLTLSSLLFSCNSKSEEDEDKYVVPSSVAVTSFNLKSNKDVMVGLENVFFSIDLNKGVIFNADSLPKGSDISKLVASVSYSDAVETAIITNGETEINYKKNPGDTIDFTKRVILTLTANAGSVSRDYLIKVNVHKSNPDSLIWNQQAVSKLPSRMANPRNQKSITQNDKALCLIEENDGTYTLSVSPDIFADEWNKQEIEFPFIPDIRTFTATSRALYLLDDAGELYESTDAQNWTSTSQLWESVIGAYTDHILGMRIENGRRLHCSYPQIGEEIEVAADFPIEGASNLGVSTTKWSEMPTAIIVGGCSAAGEKLNGVWGFDGNSWARISLKGSPAITGATLVPYYAYRRTAQAWVQNEFEAWFIIGGVLSDGTYNRDIYISYDGGINWKTGGTLISLPDYIPTLAEADNIVMTSPKSADLSDGWEKSTSPAGESPRRIKYDIDGYEISWECPYIYLFGGYTESGTLNTNVYRSVLGRLSFTPLI